MGSSSTTCAGRPGGSVTEPPRRPAGLLLTGGASRRMGRPKAALILDGVTLAERTARLLGQVAGPLVEVGPGYTNLVRTQETPAGAGPLAAVAAGWAALKEMAQPAELAESAPPAPAVIVVATDLPRLTVDLLARLVDHPGDETVVPLDGAARPQPLCARYSAVALERAGALVATGYRSMHALLDGIDVTYIEVPHPGVLTDVDTPEDLGRVAKATSADG